MTKKLIVLCLLALRAGTALADAPASVAVSAGTPVSNAAPPATAAAAEQTTAPRTRTPAATDWAQASTAVPVAAPPSAQTEAPVSDQAAASPSSQAQQGNGPAGNQPLPAPSPALSYALGQTAPLTGDEIRRIKRAGNDAQQGAAWQAVPVVPRISTLTVNLSPGAGIPLLRTALNQASSVTFADSTGAPWVLGAPPRNANSDGFQVSYIPGSAIMTVQALRQYDTGNVTVYLQGLSVPVVINLTSGEPGTAGKAQVLDSRLDLRLPLRGPGARAGAAPQGKIGLYNNVLQAFLDGVPPKDARRITTEGQVPDTVAWQLGDELYLRSRSELRDEFEQTLSSVDGTHLYQLPLTPYVTFSVMGKAQALTLNLE